MFCVIQKIENKKPNPYGEYKELEVITYNSYDSSKPKIYYGYTTSTECFTRPIKTAYKISIHHSYREDGKVKKKQWVICTIGYYDLIECCPGDCIIQDELNKKLKEMDITEDELWDMVYKKLNPIIDKITKEFEAGEEYKAKIEHKEILKKYFRIKKGFENRYGKDTYDYVGDVFVTVRNKEYYAKLKKAYKEQQEYKSSYHENTNSNYSNNDKDYDFSGYASPKSSTYTEDEKTKLKKIYKTLALKFHPDEPDGDAEMMKLVNKLKDEWRI